MDSIIKEDNLHKWLHEMLQYEEKDLINFNWKTNFNNINRILSTMNSDYEIKINCFIFLTKIITMQFVTKDTEIKSYFNDILSSLFLYTTSPNAILSRYSLKILKTLLDFNENLEYVLKYALQSTTDGRDWQDRYGGLLVIKMACESKRDFLIDKKNYCKKVIESLILGYNNCSATIKQESAETLSQFIARLPNYVEITQMLPNEMLTKIYKMQCNISTENATKASIMIDKSISLLKNNKEFIEADEENEILEQNHLINEVYIDKGGLAFGIFPSHLITKSKDDISLDEKISNFKSIYTIFLEKQDYIDFIKFSSSYFKWLSLNINNPSITISTIIIKMMNQMVSGTPGVNLITSIHKTLPSIILSFASESVAIRELSCNLLEKIAMIIPTSQLIPYLINQMSSNSSWILLNECIKFLDFLFLHLNEIYNDIEWSFPNANYNLNIFLEILKLFDHQAPKVALNARKLIKAFGIKYSGDAQHFKLTLSHYVNDSLNEELTTMFANKNALDMSMIKSNNHYDIVTQRVLSALNPLRSGIAEEEAERTDDFIYKRIQRYEDRLYESKINADENLMEKLLDAQGNIIKLTPKLPMDNYPNYDVDIPIDNTMIKKTTIEKRGMKSRLKHYNDPTEIDFNQVYDKKYDYVIKEREALSPIHDKPGFIYESILEALKNKLNWEKQFKAMDQLRKIIHNHRHLMKYNIDYYCKLIEALLDCSHSVRSHLARNALVTLSELFEVTEIDISFRFTVIIKMLLNKMQDNNTVIKEEAIKTMIALIIFSNIGKLTTEFLKNHCNSHSIEMISLIMMCFGLFLKYHRQKVFNHSNWNRMMVYVTEQFSTKAKDKRIKQVSFDFYKLLQAYFNSDSALEEYLRNYMTTATLNYLLSVVCIRNN